MQTWFSLSCSSSWLALRAREAVLSGARLALQKRAGNIKHASHPRVSGATSALAVAFAVMSLFLVFFILNYFDA